MNTRALKSVSFFFVLVGLAAAGYLVQGPPHRYYGGAVGQINPNQESRITLFNPSTTLPVSYTLWVGGTPFNGFLQPLAQHTVTPEEVGTADIEANGDLLAWKVSEQRDTGVVTGRHTLPFAATAQAEDAFLFPWIQAFSGLPYDSGFFTITNTSPFTATFVHTIYDASNGVPYAQPAIQVGPEASRIVPAVPLSPCISCPTYGLLQATNGALVLASYTANESYGALTYWAEPTSSFSSLLFRPFGAGDGPLRQADGQKTFLAGTGAFSRNMLLYEDDTVSSRYTFFNKELHTAMTGEVTADIVQTQSQEIRPIAAPGLGVPATLDGASLVPGGSRYTGTVAVESFGYTPASIVTYTSDSGNLAAALPASEVLERAVFALDGSLPWDNQLSGSVFVLHNKLNQPVPLAVVLLDADGDLVDIRYTLMEPGASEWPVADLVTGYPDTRTVLVEAARHNASWSMHLLRTASGEGYAGTVVDYVAAAQPSGCRSFGLGVESFYNWAAGYTVPCGGGGPPSVLGLVAHINQGLGLPTGL